MLIQSLELNHYRNYDSLKINFDKGTTILFGDNAQGKTNILEAIYLAGTTKSHRGSKDREIISFKSEESHIRTYINKNEIQYKIDMHLRKYKSKGIAINGIQIKKASELLGLINVVFFSPEDLNIIKRGPGERRRFIDLELCQLDKLYLYQLTNYNKILNHRNKLLKDIAFYKDYESMLDLWDEQLIDYGRKIIERREQFVQELNEILNVIHKSLSGEKENLYVKYNPDVEKNALREKLLKNRERDIRQKITSLGPHRDDLTFFIKKIDIRKYGSQGQQRTAALSLKLSEIELVKKTTNDNPILLLDDVLSELDRKRQDYLLNNIGNIQTIMTCTGLDDFVKHRFNINKVYKVIEGTVEKGN